MKVKNAKQFEMLIAELEKNPNLAKGFQRGISSSNFKQNWEEIAFKINAVGPPQRNSDGWQKVWRDLKFKVKKKMTHNKAESSATGGGRNRQLHLSFTEEAVASIMTFEAQLNPDGIFIGISAPEDANAEDVQSDDLAASEPCNNEVPCVSTENISKNVSSNRSKKSDQKALLQKHHEMQEKVFKEMSSTFKSMKDHFKDIARYDKKHLELAQRKAEREDELFQMNIQIKKIKLEILKKQLNKM